MGRHYHVAYHGVTVEGHPVFGSWDVTLTEPIRSYADVELAASAIQARNPILAQVAILSWQRYEED